MTIAYEHHTLANGLRVLTAPMHETSAAAVLILVGTGSRFESPPVAGISHFLEHMFFKGTKKRPTYLDVSIELDSLGANYNAFTGQEYTGYFVHSSAEQFDRSLDILADMLLHGTLPDAEVAKEKGVITEELNMYWDIPQSAVAQTVEKLLYAPNPLGTPIVGTKQSIAATTRTKLMDYKRRTYVPSNMVVAVAGNPGGRNWRNRVESYFGRLRRGSAPAFQPFAASQRKPTVEVIQRTTDQAHFIVAWHGLKRTDRRRPALKVLNTILGGMMSSRLFEEIREKRGLAYYVNSGFDEFHDTGSFFARAGVVTGKIEEAIKVVIETIEQFKHTAVSAADLKRAKDNLNGQLYLGLENSFAVAEFLAEQELLWGRVEQPDKIAADVKNVTAADVKAVAMQLIAPQRLNVAVIGPYPDDKPFKKLVEA